MRPMNRSSNDIKHYHYVFIYVDKVVSISDDRNKILHNIDKYFDLNLGYISDLNIYLSAKLKPMRKKNGVLEWSFIPSQYIQEDVKNTGRYIKENLEDI